MSRLTFVLAAFVVIALSGSLAWGDDAVAAIEFRRLYVPVGQEKIWPRNGFLYAPVIRLSDFENSIQAIRATRGGPGDVARIRTTELVGRVSESMIEGEATFELSLAKENFGQAQQFVSFEGTNLEFSPLEMLAPAAISNQASATRPGFSNGEVGIWVTEAAPKLRWRAVAAESGEFSLRLPPAAASSLRLHLGADQQIQSDIGIVQEIASPSDEEAGEWLLLPDALGQIDFRIVDRRDAKSPSPLHVAQHGDYKVGVASIAVVTRFICVSTAEPLRKFELSSDARLILTGVHVVDRQQRRRAIAWEQSPPNEAGKRRVTVRLPDNEDPLSEFEFTGVVPIESSPTSMKAPLLSVDPAVWQEGELTISLNDSWRITTLGVRSGKQLRFDQGVDESNAKAQFVLFQPSAAIDFSLTRIEPRLLYRVGNSVRIEPTKIVTQTTAIITAEEGETLDLDFGLLENGWSVDSLTTDSAEIALERWYVADDGRLIVRLKQPITETGAITLRGKFSRPRRDSEIGYDTSKLKPLQLEGNVLADWIRISADETLELRPSPESAELLIDATMLPETALPLLPDEPTQPNTLLFATRSPRYGDPVVLAIPKRGGYLVAIHCDVLLRDNEMKERVTIRVDGAGDFSEPLLLQATASAEELQKWRLNDGIVINCPPLQTQGADTTKLATYELRMPPGTRLPVTLTADISRPITTSFSPILLATPQVATQTNQLEIAAPRLWRLSASEAFPLSPVYEITAAAADPLQNHQYRYRASDVSRAHELDGRPLLTIDKQPAEFAPYAESANYRYELRHDSILADADYCLIAADTGNLKFQFPPNSRLLATKLDGQPVVASALGDDRYEVKIHGGARSQVCSIRYESAAPNFPLLRPFALQRPQASFDVLQANVSVETSQLTFFSWDTSLSSHLRSMFLHGLYASGGEAARRQNMEMDDSSLSVWAVDPQQIQSLGYTMLGIGFLAGWLTSCRRIGLLIAALTIAFAAILLPTTLAPITAGILQGLTAGVIVRWFATSWREADSSSDSRSVSAAAGYLLILVFLFPAATLVAQQPATSDAKPVTYPIWIPIDGNKQPTGDVYLPQTLYDYLFSAAKNPIYMSQRVDVTAASWRISPPTTNLPDTFSVAGLFDVTSLFNGSSLTFPLSSEFLAGMQSVLVDEIPMSMADFAEKEELTITFDDAGDHRVKIVAQLPADQSVLWQTPPCLDTELRYESIASKPIAQILADGKPLPFLSLSTFTSIPLGSVRQLGWIPTADSQDGRFQAKQVDLFQLGQPSPTLISRIQLTPISGLIKTCRLQFDPRLRWNEVKLPGTVIAATEGGLAVTFDPPIAEPVTLEFSFTLNESSGVGSFDLPSVTVADAETKTRWTAIAAPQSVETIWRKEASALATVATPVFAAEWPVPIEDLRRAFDLSDEAMTPAIVEVQPIASRMFITANQYVHVGSQTSNYRLDLQLEALAGEPNSLLLEMSKGWWVDNVTYISDGVVRDVVWQYDEPTSRLSLFFAAPLSALAELRIEGHFATDMAIALEIKSPRIVDAQIDSSYLHISYDPDVRLRRLPEIGAPMFDTAASEAAQPLESVQGQSFGSYRVLDPQGVMQLTVLRNNMELGGEMLLSARGDEEGWTVRIDCRLRLKRIVPDQFEFLAPANYKLKTTTLLGFDITQRSLGEAGVIWQLRPMRPLSEEFQISLIADVETPSTGDLVLRPVRLLGQYPPQYLAVPRSFNSQQIIWGMRELQSVGFPDSWFAMHVPPGSLVYQSLSGSYQCRIDGLLPTEEMPRILSLRHDVKVADESTCLTSTTMYVSPEGSDHLSFQLPADAKLLSASIEGKVVSATTAEDGAVTIPFLSRALPQKLQVSYVYPSATQVPRPLDVLRVDPRVTTTTPLWRIESQRPLDCDFSSFSVVEWRTDRFAETWRRWKRGIRNSDASSTEIAAWKQRRLQEADNAWRALAALQSELQGDRFDAQRQFRDITAGDELALLQAEVTKAGLKLQTPRETWSHVYYGKADSVHLHWQKSSWDFDWRRPLLVVGGVLASIVLLGLFWRQPEWIDISAAWVSRWPHALGAAAGIVWGLFLQPAFIGWIVAAVFVMAASPLRLGRSGGSESGRSFLGKLERSVHKARR